jgi:hypothetical protein
VAGLPFGDDLLDAVSTELLQPSHLGTHVLRRCRPSDGQTQVEVNSVPLRRVGTMLNMSVDPLARQVRNGAVRMLKFDPSR